MSELLNTTALTRSQKTATEIGDLLRARVPVIVIETEEESRVERYLIESAAIAGYVPRTWDCGQGVCDMSGKRSGGLGGQLAEEMVDFVMNRANGTERGLWIMRDLIQWLKDPITLRKVCNFARSRPTMLRESTQAIVILSPVGAQLPPELKGHCTVVQWPLPDRDEIAACLREAIKVLVNPAKIDQGFFADLETAIANAAPNGTFDNAVDAACGLTEAQAAACYGRSLVTTRAIVPQIVADEKKRLVSREKVLEIFDPLPGGFNAIGGLENAKAFIRSRKLAYKASARAYGLPAPRGVFLTGVPGNAKSMIAKATATEFECPLVRFDPGALKSKFVGESEANMRKAIQTIEAMGRCIVWIDEIEKGLQGATSGSADGGTSADQLGSLLTFLQERKGESFVIATSNDAEALPPELLRKGRFDEVFFVDNPARAERSQIVAATLRTNKRPDGCVDCDAVAAATDDFSGAELAALVPEAMFTAYADGERVITTADVLAAAKQVNPLAKQRADKIAKLRAWGKERARQAGVTETEKPRLAAVDF